MREAKIFGKFFTGVGPSQGGEFLTVEGLDCCPGNEPAMNRIGFAMERVQAAPKPHA